MNTTPNRTRTDRALHYRQLAVRVANRAQAQYEIAVLDHVTARILDAHPEATHLTFDHHDHTRELDLHALWTTHHGGTEELLLDIHRDTDFTGLDFAEITDDLCDALAARRSAAWSAVRPEPRPDRRWVLDLPPADRIARITDLVHAHHPRAGVLAIDLRSDPARVVGVTLLDDAGLAKDIDARGDTPLWPAETERQITALVQQIHALSHLATHHLAYWGDSPERSTAVLLLPMHPESVANGVS